MAEESAPSSLDEFPEQIQEDVEGLIYLGHLEDSFELFGHTFTIRTLKGDEELYAGTLTKDYQSTLTQAKAWAWANVSQALVAVDGDSNFCPAIGPDREASARARFKYCTSRWYWLLCSELFDRLIILIQRQLDAAEAVRDLSLRSPGSFSPSPDSSTDQGDSESPEITQYLDEASTESSVSS